MGHRTNPIPNQLIPDRALQDSLRNWRRWSARLKYKGKYREAVERSLITLKALTFRPTGGIVAAPTTSLPERIGGVRNWDYRYCWLRDTTFTLLALMNAGYFDEAEAWQDWLLRALAGSPDQVQIMYGLKGERSLSSGRLTGSQDTKIRALCASATRHRNSCNSTSTARCWIAFFTPSTAWRHYEDDFSVLVLLLKHLETIWQKPDQGIWETRGKPQHFTYSKMMAWVAFDRAVLLAEQLKYEAPVEKWKTIRDAIHKQICEKAFDKKKNSFVQAYGSNQLDASLLLMPAVGFLPGSDRRVKGTVKAIERELMPRWPGAALRHHKFDDGLPSGRRRVSGLQLLDGERLKAIGRKRDARKLFEKLLACATTWACFQRSTMSSTSAWWEIFPRLFRTSRW